MDHNVITLIKWLFLANGIGLLVGATFVQPRRLSRYHADTSFLPTLQQ